MIAPFRLKLYIVIIIYEQQLTKEYVHCSKCKNIDLCKKICTLKSGYNFPKSIQFNSP